MTSQKPLLNNLYETSELKLAALVLSELPDCIFEVCEQENSLRKIIRIKYQTQWQSEISRLEKDFINKKATANVYLYNRSLNLIRDRLRGKEKWQTTA